MNIMKLTDLDFDELLECAEEDIESSAFFASSVQIMGILDQALGAIDDRLSKKKAQIAPLGSTKNNPKINSSLQPGARFSQKAF